MYKKQVPFKDFNGKPHTTTVHFNLTEREIFKLMGEFQIVLDWFESMRGPERQLETAEVVNFYTAFEDILLAAYGIPSDDGFYFRKGGRYDFEESALFNACMVDFVSNPTEVGKLIEAIMPKGLEDLIKTADENLVRAAKETDDEDVQAQIQKLQAELAEARKENGQN